MKTEKIFLNSPKCHFPKVLIFEIPKLSRLVGQLAQ